MARRSAQAPPRLKRSGRRRVPRTIGTLLTSRVSGRQTAGCHTDCGIYLLYGSIMEIIVQTLTAARSPKTRKIFPRNDLMRLAGVALD